VNLRERRQPRVHNGGGASSVKRWRSEGLIWEECYFLISAIR
jgi:hypothetical protein